MSVSIGSIATSTIAGVIGFVMVAAGIAMFASGPFFEAHQSSNSGLLGIGSSSSSGATINLLPVLGLVFVLIGAVILVVGLRGAMRGFERGKDRDEGTRSHVVIERIERK